MTKPVTIPKLDVELYEKTQVYRQEKGLTTSDFFNKLLSDFVSDENIDTLRVEIDKLNTLLKEKSEFITSLEFASAENLEKIEKLQAENTTLQNQNQTLSDNIATLQAENRQESTESNEGEHAQNYTVLVRFTPLEFALINFVAEKETQRLSEEINPCDILRTMFIEYSLRGSEWFFPYPKRKEIEMLKEKLKNQE
ncbi:MAG: hypothetical protein UIQ67_02360 [Bacteroidales bacterium]|nr:hypothetical protein [Bacteroidales bacterium]